MPQDGAIRALVGGFDFNKNKFNHVTQAWRQPGSSFKPFIYSASLEKGLSTGDHHQRRAALLQRRRNRRPGVGAEELRRRLRRPDVDAHRAAEVEEPGVDPHPDVHRHASTRRTTSRSFGFDADKTPAYLPMALGAGLVTPLQMAAAYSVFANGGYRVNPYLIAEVTDPRGTRHLACRSR